MSQDKFYDNLLSYLEEFYPDDSQTQPLTFTNYPHLQKIANLMTDLLNVSERRKLNKEEIQLIIRACSTLVAENNDISASEIQTNRVVRQKRLASESEFDEPETLREKITDLHQQIAIYSTEMKNHKDQVESLRDEISELKDENDNLQRKFNELKRTREDEVSKLTVQKEEIGDQYKIAMLDLKLETDKGLNLSTQIENMMKETTEKDEGIEKLQQKNREQKDLLRKAKSLLKTLETRIVEDNATIDRLNKQIKKLKTQSPNKTKMEKTNSSLKEENKFLQDKLIKLTDSNEKNLKTITYLLSERQQISEELSTSKAQKDKSEREIDELTKRIEKLLNQNPEQSNNRSSQSRSPQRKNNETHSKSPTSPKGNFNLSDFEENSTSTFNDVFESANQQPRNDNEDTISNYENDYRSNRSNNNNKDDNNKHEDQIQEMQGSLRKVAHLFKKANIKPSELPIIPQILKNQDQLLNRFRSTIDAQARFITHLINEDYVAPHLLSNDQIKKDSDRTQGEEEEEEEEEGEEESTTDKNKDNKKEYSTASVFKDEELKNFVLKAVEDTRQVAYEKLKDSDTGFDEIVLYDTIFDQNEGADLLIAEQESRGADNELAALAILLSVIIKQRKISESDAKFINSVYRNMSFDPDHPATIDDASKYIDDIHESIKKLRKFYTSEIKRFSPEKDNSEFLEALVNDINELSSSVKESAGFKGKLSDIPEFLSTQNKPVQARDIDLNESENNNTEEDFGDDSAPNLNSFSFSDGENNNNNNNNKNDNLNNNAKERDQIFPINENNSKDDDSIFGERINSVPGKNNDTNTQKLREEINNYKNEIKKLKQQLDDANTTSEVLQEAFDSFHKKNEEMEKNARVITAERDRLQNLLDERDKQFDKRLKNATNHFQNQKDQEIKIMKTKYEEENKLLAQKIDSRDKRLREIKKSMKEIIGMYEDLLMRQREEMRELSKKNDEVETESKKYIHDRGAKKKEIAELRAQITELIQQRSNDLSLTVTSANNSLSLENTNTNTNPNTTNNVSSARTMSASAKRNTNTNMNTNTNTDASLSASRSTNRKTNTNLSPTRNRNANANMNDNLSPTRNLNANRNANANDNLNPTRNRNVDINENLSPTRNRKVNDNLSPTRNLNADTNRNTNNNNNNYSYSLNNNNNSVTSF